MFVTDEEDFVPHILPAGARYLMRFRRPLVDIDAIIDDDDSDDDEDLIESGPDHERHELPEGAKHVVRRRLPLLDDFNDDRDPTDIDHVWPEGGTHMHVNRPRILSHDEFGFFLPL